MEGTHFGHYQLLSLLGRGGMGEVWRAHDTHTNRVVALKVLPTDLAGHRAFEERFRREARAAAGLHEPHVVPIHDYGEIDGRLYVDMRLIVGADLEQLLDDGPLDPGRAVRIVEQIALALRAAHDVGLIHRDVKPSNILVAAADHAYLIDFGIARTADETSVTSRGSMIGTWAYMAPERFGTGEIDSRSDVYALTCVLHQSLTGQRPFPGDGMERQVVGHLSSPPPQPCAVNACLPPAFDNVIAKGMDKSPDQRYDTTVELAAAARAALTTATSARPPITPPSPKQLRENDVDPLHTPPLGAGPKVPSNVSPSEPIQNPTEPSVPVAAPDRSGGHDDALPNRRRLAVAGLGATAILTVGAIVAALAWPTDTPTAPASPPTGSANAAPLDTLVEGDPSAPVNKVALKAVADLQAFWAHQFPTLYGGGFKPVAGGLYALSPESKSGSGSACASSYGDVAGDAFYCKVDDSVDWDASGLLPELQSKYGDFVIAVMLAREWGHAVQQRSGYSDQNAVTVSSHLQADCFAGAWSKHAQADKVFDVSSADLDRALAGILDLRDTPGTVAEDPSAHGSGFDRVNAFQDGYDNSVEKCKGYKDGEPKVLELPFNNHSDVDTGGNAPYDTIVNGVPLDLEDYWAQVYPELAAGRRWQPLKGDDPFDPSNPPACGGQPTKGYVLFYCVPDDYVGWDNVTAMPKIYKQAGDYAVATLLASQWGLAALTRLGDDSDEKTSSLRGDCLAGSYTASVILYNRPDTSSFHISPGDLDEGIKALLLFRGEGDADRQGAGFDRTRAFREGLSDGAKACLAYKA